MARDLRTCIDQALAGTRTANLRDNVARLTDAYRSGGSVQTPLLSDADAVLAYIAYRMPATYAVCVAALRAARDVVPGFQPRSLVDVGAGTGAMAWAAVQAWPELAQIDLYEQSGAAIDVGKKLARLSAMAPLESATWRQWQLASGASTSASDIATAAYVLGELTSEQQSALVALLAKSAPVVVLIEPGTPAGFARIAKARATLIDTGFTVLAPCPHDETCPMETRGDWCHFSERLERSRLHRAVKDAELSYEDEKYSYVVAARVGVIDAVRPAARILRHPKQRKGLVTLEVCSASGNALDVAVAKSDGPAYKAARHARWGDGWPASG